MIPVRELSCYFGVFFRSFFLAFANLERFLHFINQWGELAGVAQLYVETPFLYKIAGLQTRF